MDLRQLLSPRTLLAALIVTVLLVVIFAGSTSTAAFGVYNPSWDGTSGVQSVVSETDAESTIALETTTYSEVDADSTIAFVVSPTEEYSQEEIEQLREFVQSGGTLVVAEDFGPVGNQVLAGLGVETRFDGRLVRDPRMHGPTTAMPIATVSNESRFAAVNGVMLNHGTVLETENTTTYMNTSEFSYIDRDADDEVDSNETLQSYPVVSAERVGDGNVIAVSDPSIFINAMLDRSSNEAFTRALIEGHTTVLLDYSHAESAPPLRAAILWFQSTPIGQVLLGAPLLLFVGYWARRS